ncbi:MAG: hypothetical protein HXS44_17025 [Theionarchaea archaeon]|nr:hypothetical protein [Theionarchaea archaeon]
MELCALLTQSVTYDDNDNGGDVDDKSKQNQARDKSDKVQDGREKHREWTAEKNRETRSMYWVDSQGRKQDSLLSGDNGVSRGNLPSHIVMG